MYHQYSGHGQSSGANSYMNYIPPQYAQYMNGHASPSYNNTNAYTNYNPYLYMQPTAGYNPYMHMDPTLMNTNKKNKSKTKQEKEIVEEILSTDHDSQP
ncbi:hypothetical protein [Aquisalibacillus elongatus]|uniref:Uncharacterized protein n=1 Tax=Aquisalibacillus elongatus TaxID=485577 RepID=A0A3N5B6W7_9BACI|nr:hypothetical protein [Aquisalibacillus elongatus]RPF53436.1 hypothetical protein EDC24_1936 [Aquisalibacillus elongatus]